MADNTEESHLDNPTTKQSENSPGEISPSADTETFNPHQETENMEVHHHAHHEGKKNWKSYLWEFLMLFLAVFCGFLAEYQLEHKIERDREKVYIKNLYEDLKDDVVNFAEYDKSASELFATIDTVMMVMKSEERSLHKRRLYYLVRKATMNSLNFFSTNSRTYEQMKHSGHLRLIKNQQVADSVSGYYFSLNKIDFQNNIVKDRIAEYMQAAGRVFDAQVLFKIFKDKQEPTDATLKFITHNEQDINIFLTSTQYYYGARKLQYEMCIKQSKRMQNLLELIKKEYHLDN